MDFEKQFPLGRVIPKDLNHITKYPYSAVMPEAPAVVERVLPLPSWHLEHNQGSEGACVGHGTGMMQVITNSVQSGLPDLSKDAPRYDMFDLYHEAQKIDDWPGEDYSGTSMRAGCDILRTRGPIRILKDGKKSGPHLEDGILANRWAINVDEIRTAISEGRAVALGCNWYRNFDKPVQPWKQSSNPAERNEWWIANLSQTGWLTRRGGHCTCIIGASDRRQAVLIKNS